MASRIILLSGHVASGKTTLGSALERKHSFKVFKTRELIQTMMPSVGLERGALQAAGEQLDRRHGGRWVANALHTQVNRLPMDATIILDSVRTIEQIEAIRSAYGPRVVHLHLDAPLPELKKRYAKRRKTIAELASYEAVQKSATEKNVGALMADADIVIDTSRCTAEDVLVRVESHLGLYGRGVERLVDVIVGGQYGSEGKGHITSYLAREYGVLIRVGGPNAGHTVYLEPTPYTYHHLPSGTIHAPEARLVLGAGAVLSLRVLLEEIAECHVEQRLTIDPNAIVIDPADVRAEEAGLRDAIGSTAQGVGFATSRKILRTSAKPPVRLAKDVPELKLYVGESRAVLEQAFSRGSKVFLEGTQGTGLSIHHGFYPHVTSRDTSVSGALSEAGIAPGRVRKVIMVCRTFPIRVQSPKNSTSGPMSREITWSEVARRSGIPALKLKEAEKTSTTKRRRRVGEFEWDGLRKASTLNGPTDIALTFVDYLEKRNRDARRFEQLTSDTIRFVEEVERVGGAPVSLIATRFHSRSIIDRRAW